MTAPATDQDEIDEWVIQTSKVAKRDLRPCFLFWGWELTERVEQELKDLALYFWDDETTREWAPSRAAFIMSQFPTATRQVCCTLDVKN